MPQYMWVDWMIRSQNPSCGNCSSNQDQWVCDNIIISAFKFFFKVIEFP